MFLCLFVHSCNVSDDISSWLQRTFEPKAFKDPLSYIELNCHLACFTHLFMHRVPRLHYVSVCQRDGLILAKATSSAFFAVAQQQEKDARAFSSQQQQSSSSSASSQQGTTATSSSSAASADSAG